MRLSTQTAMPEELPVLQPESTYSGSPIDALHKGLPKITQSLCPECGELIEAHIFEAEGKAKMEKTCPLHGDFSDTISSDVGLYLKMERFHFGDNRGLSNPAIPKATRCPEQCGLCSMHASHTGLANVDLTNRCNLTCPVCFANANVAGYLYEPSFEQVQRMLQALRDERPVAGRVVQFSGGEPTLHPRFHDICALAREMGFSHIQAATNGILFADLEFAQKAKESGLHQLYLQFDGVCDDIYRRTRGASLLEPKLQAIENCRKVGLKIVFVPTIVKGVNDHQIGDLVRLALENIDCTSGLTFQPVAFTGRINRHDLAAKRFTLADVAHAVSEQTAITDAYHDWFPLSCVTPFSRLISALRGEETVTLTCHPHCSMGTYLFVEEKSKKAVPVTRFMDIPGLLREIEMLARSAGRSRIKFFSKIKAWNRLQKHFKPELAPPGLTFNRWVQTIQGCVDKKYGRDGMDGTYSYRTLMVAGMHFMDAYNYDVERVKRCVIHYAAPNGLIYPFCAYNSGPVFREKIEKKYSIPFARGNGNGNGNAAPTASRSASGTE